MNTILTDQPIGVVGLGLLGRGIAASLLANGFRVIGCNRSAKNADVAREHAKVALGEVVEHLGASPDLPDLVDKNFVTTQDINDLAKCGFIIESAVESLEEKRKIFDQLEALVSPETIIASNTSALPITILQEGRKHPERFIGMHWGEPCHIIRFLEVIRGEKTSDSTAEITHELGTASGKDVVMVRKDIRGFITNRLMYAFLREAFYLLEQGVGTVEDIDASFRNDIGTWAPIAGPFRWMDLTGIPAYHSVMSELAADLCNDKKSPDALHKMAESGALGTANQRGFYSYTPEEAAKWEEIWRDYTWEGRRLADKYNPLKKP
ncbi:MAG: 3-hydroxyacyl-CoA dehydrogenase family protein [Chthoniobacterales bacterium]